MANPPLAGLFEFFVGLANNNQKTWFDEHRKTYENDVKKPFQLLTESLIASISKFEPALKDVRASDCIFRINRDVRFSKDKTPYKLYMGAVIATGGKKEDRRSAFYFQLGVETCAVYMGLYMPPAETVQAVRNGIADDGQTLNKLLNAPAFKTHFNGLEGEVQKRLTPDLKQAAETFPLVQNKQWYFSHVFEPETVLENNAHDYLLGIYKAGKPVHDWLNKVASI